jgi:hypothetical protein
LLSRGQVDGRGDMDEWPYSPGEARAKVPVRWLPRLLPEDPTDEEALDRSLSLILAAQMGDDDNELWDISITDWCSLFSRPRHVRAWIITQSK